jgi:hypothetical protein
VTATVEQKESRRCTVAGGANYAVRLQLRKVGENGDATWRSARFACDRHNTCGMFAQPLALRTERAACGSPMWRSLEHVNDARK